jgi:hypothetical protein
MHRRIGRDGWEAIRKNQLVRSLDLEGNDNDIERAEIVRVMSDGCDIVVTGRKPIAASSIAVSDRASCP